jgi:hypothetical protein
MAAKKQPAVMPADQDPPKPAKVGEHPNVFAAKLAATREMGVVQMKRAEGGHGYIPEDGVVEAAREVMLSHGLTVTPRYVRVEKHQPFNTRVGAVMHMAVVTVEYRLTHAASGTHDDGAAAGEGVDVGDKALGMAMTRAFLHYIRQAFFLRSGLDPDRKDSDAVASAPGQTRRESVLGPGTEVAEDAARAQPAAAGRQTPTTPAPQTPPPQESHRSNGKGPHRADEPGMRKPSPPEGVDPRPPKERPGLPREKVDAVVAVLKRAETQERLDWYRKTYREERNFNQDQIDELDKLYRQRADELAKRDMAR